jgi:HEAT repeat protein
MALKRTKAGYFFTFLIIFCKAVFAEQTEEHIKEIYSALGKNEIQAAGRREMIRPLLSVTDPEVKTQACFALGFLGDTQVSAEAKRLLHNPSYEVVIDAAFCLAVSAGAASASLLAPLLSHKEELVRGHVGTLLAQFKNNQVAWKALQNLLEQEKQSSVAFNVLKEMRGWTAPETIKFLVHYLEKSIARKTFINANAVAAILGDVSDQNPLALKTLTALFANAKRFPGGLMSLARAIDTTYLPKAGTPKRLALLEQKLVDVKTEPADRSAIARVIGNFRSPKSMAVFEKALGVCDSTDCTTIAWVAAEQGPSLGGKTLQKALASSNAEVREAVRGIGIYQNATDKKALVLGAMEKFLSHKERASFDSVDRLTQLIELSTCDTGGISSETIETLALSSEAVFPLPHEQIGKCYAYRFAGEPLKMARFALKLPSHSVLADTLASRIQANPSSEACRGLIELMIKGSRSIEKWQTKLPIISMRLARKC